MLREQTNTPLNSNMRTTNRKPKKPDEPLDVHISQKKFDQMQHKLKRLKADRTPAAMEVTRLAELGDFSENVEYQLAKGRLRSINNSILNIETFLNAAIVIQPTGSTVIELGSTVTIMIDAEQKIYTILGSSETSPSDGIVSQNSPIGQALLGRKEGETFETTIGPKKKQITILSVK